MTISLGFLALIMATVVWWLLKPTLNATPWVPDVGLEFAEDPSILAMPPAKVALGVFLAVVTSFFALLLSAYLMRMELGDWHRLDDPSILWFNTIVLVLASLAFQKASAAIKKEQADGTRMALLVGGALTIVFIIGQLWAWQQLADAGFFAASNPAYAFFYLITGIHGLHLLGGLWVWSRTTVRTFQGEAIDQVRLSVELCTTYWHFLLLVWVGLFILLLVT
jgi:cytochrome c oxidase subunit 3